MILIIWIKIVISNIFKNQNHQNYLKKFIDILFLTTPIIIIKKDYKINKENIQYIEK